MSENSLAPITSLYVHVPFCAQKCEYCAFYSEASSGELINRYVAALVRELEMVAGDLQPKTIFFGGGTPAILNLRQWEIILRAMEKLKLLGAEEFTIESNPATVSADKCKLLRRLTKNCSTASAGCIRVRWCSSPLTFCVLPVLKTSISI
jgi:oxygen-independent coproporphyrinogen-3 oxidase